MTQTNDNATTTRPVLPPDTQVVSKLDGEPGRIEKACTFNRNGTRPMSYAVQTTYGREIWDACDIFVPSAQH